MSKLTFEHVRPGIGSSLAVLNFTKNNPCTGIGWHVHPEFEIVYVRNGAGRLNVATRSLTYDDGLLLFLGPDIPHTELGNNDRPDGIEVVIQFTREFVETKLRIFPEFGPAVRLTERAAGVLRFGRATRRRLDAVFAGMIGAPPAGRLLGTLDVLRHLSEVPPDEVQRLFSHPIACSGAKPHDVRRLESVFSFVNESYADGISSSDAAARVGLTTNAFCRFFRRHTQRNFTDFLNEFRVERARDLLLREEVSVREAMYSVGFRDPAYFSRVFKRYVGEAPSRIVSGV